MQETEDIVTRLRDWCINVRRKPSPLSDAIPMAQEAATTIATLRAEVEGLRADAERYRWLRESGASIAYTIRHGECRKSAEVSTDKWTRRATLDAAIDAAKAGKEGA